MFHQLRALGRRPETEDEAMTRAAASLEEAFSEMDLGSLVVVPEPDPVPVGNMLERNAEGLVRLIERARTTKADLERQIADRQELLRQTEAVIEGYALALGAIDAARDKPAIEHEDPASE